MHGHAQQGFTLLEIILVITILGVVGTMSVTTLGEYQKERGLDEAASRLVVTLAQTQLRAAAGEGEYRWGVVLDNTQEGAHSYTVFHGESFAQALPEDIENSLFLSQNMMFSMISLNGGGDEILFERRSGRTQQYGTGADNLGFCITLINQSGSCLRSIHISPSGLTEWKSN